MPLTSRPNTARTKAEIRSAGILGVRRALRAVQARHQEVVDPWQQARDKPKFTIEVKTRGSEITGLVWMSGSKAEQASITVWQLLQHGTRIRYMQLSEDWQSKTGPGSIFSGPGAGRTTGLDTKNPWPGIEARSWVEQIEKIQKPVTDAFVFEGWQDGFWRGIG